MFWINLLVAVFLGLECYSLYQKKLKKTSIRFAILTIIYLVINILMLYKSLKVEYSSIIYLMDALTNNPIITILWILINIALYLYLVKEMLLLRKKHKQNKKILLGVLISYLIYDILLVFVLFHNSS